VRLRLEDTGEGWFWHTPSLEAEVIDQVQVHSRRFYRVAFPEPLRTEETGPPGPYGVASATYPGGWLSPRWVGHEVLREGVTVALLWLLDEHHEADEPDSELPFSARVACRQLD
jgi:hypothetical protein